MCNKCYRTKNVLTNFCRNSQMKDGYQHYCKQCYAEMGRERTRILRALKNTEKVEEKIVERQTTKAEYHKKFDRLIKCAIKADIPPSYVDDWIDSFIQEYFEV